MARKDLLLIALVVLGACTHAEEPNSLRYPGSTRLETLQGTTRQVYDPPIAGNCATSLTTYGVDDPVADVAAYYTDRGVELSSQPPNQIGPHVVWLGEREGDEDTWAHVMVLPGDQSSHRTWETVVVLALPRCDLEAAAEYTIGPRVVRPDETPAAVLRNTGDIDLFHGVDYQVDRRSHRRWVPFNQPKGARPLCAFISIGLTLPPDDAYTDSISVCGDRSKSLTWAPGYYRVTKEVAAEGIKEFVLRAFFRVRR